MSRISLEHRTYIQFLAEEGWQARAIHRLFRERGITTYSVSGIQRILAKLRRYHTVANRPRSGRPRTIRTEENVVRVRTVVQERKGLVSHTTLARQLNLSRSSIHRILTRDLHLTCYKPIRTQKLNAQAIEKRRTYAQFILDTYVPDLSKIIFSDESYFSIGEFLCPQNRRIWTDTKKKDIPVDVLTTPVQSHPEKVMIWAGLSQRGKLPLIFFEPKTRLTALGYKRLVLIKMIPKMRQLYENTPFIFQQDGAPVHTALDNKRYLASKHVTLLERYPPHSPDLSPLDYFVFGTLKQRVYADPAPATLDELKERIRLEWDNLPQPMIIKAINQFPKRLRMVIEEGGGVIQHKLEALKR